MARKSKEVKVEATEIAPVVSEPAAEQTAHEEQTRKLFKRQIDGKINRKGARSLYELLGEKYSPYDQKTEAEYASYLNTLNLTDLQMHASQVGVIPKDNIHQTIDNLLRQFRLVSSDYYNTTEIQPIKLKPSKKIIQILSEGR
jgi:hypothetical protein